MRRGAAGGEGGAVRTELGCAGHFIGSQDCRFRRHTQTARHRISTVGDLFSRHEEGRQTLGADSNSFFETFVFELTDAPAENNEGCGCRKVVSWNEIDGSRWATAGEAQAGHEAFVAKYEALETKPPEPVGDSGATRKESA